MNFDDYQRRARLTAVYPYNYRVVYPVMGLTGEAGELANKLKKVLRGDMLSPDKDQLMVEALARLSAPASLEEQHIQILLSLHSGPAKQITPLQRSEMLAELGDLLWYIAAIATDLEASLDDVANANLEKLKARQAQGKIKGSGDHR